MKTHSTSSKSRLLQKALLRYSHSETRRGGEERRGEGEMVQSAVVWRNKEYTAEVMTFSKIKNIRCRGTRACSGLYLDSTQML